MGQRNNTVDDFWVKVKKSDGCWEWQGCRDSGGYGFFWWNNKQLKAHRFLAQYILRWNIADLMVCHKCDNPSCVRPDHLFVGTTDDNMADMVAKGRSTKGVPKSADHRAKIGAARLGHEVKPETRAKLRAANLGKRHTKEARAKMSAARAGVPRPDLIGKLAGENNGNCKISDAQVNEMRAAYARGEKIARIARAYGIGESQAHRIVKKQVR